jgi:hypothetical protein
MDFTSLYRGFIKKSPEEDRAQIAAGFQDIIKRGVRTKLRLVNYYKGLPLSYPATPVEIERGVLELDVHQQQAVVLDATRFTFIKCDYFDHAILAETKDVDVRRMTASLYNFSFVEILAELRSSLRLDLEPPTDAEVKGDGIFITGKVVDLSLGGFSIRPEVHCELPQMAEVTLQVMVPNLLQGTLSSMEAKGRHVETVNPGGEEICRFSIDDDAKNEGLLSRFIFQRQVEIIRELKEQS